MTGRSEGPEQRLRLVVGAEGAARRLDLFLADSLPDHSRSYLQKLIRDGMVRIEGETASPRAGRNMTAGETVLVTMPLAKPSGLEPEAISLSILYEDDRILVVNKASGMVIHPGAGRATGTLVHALLHHCPDLSGIGGVERPGIVHRLDKETSGVIVVAKDDTAHRELSRQFEERTVKKTYVALVEGRLTSGAGTIDLPIGRDSRQRVKISSRTRHPRAAVTRFQVLERFGSHTWVEVNPLTGRTHQIRVHLKSIGHPIVMDRTYGSRSSSRAAPVPGLERLALHALRLSISHPESGEELTFEAPLPDDLNMALTTLRSGKEIG